MGLLHLYFSDYQPFQTTGGIVPLASNTDFEQIKTVRLQSKAVDRLISMGCIHVYFAFHSW